jgi:hypothetical protein
MKIQIVKKGAGGDRGGSVCPWFLDVPPPDNKQK